MRDQVRAAGDVVLSLRPVVEAARRATRRKLRVLGYHGVQNPTAFDRQMAYIRDRYNPVSAKEVEAAATNAHDLPDFAVWVTFDDGLPSVMRNALPILEARNISATMFVCPGVIDTSEPLWWQLVEACAREGIRPLSQAGSDTDALILQYKTLNYEELLSEIASLKVSFRRKVGRDPEHPQLTTDDLRRLLEAGHTIGNHTWTHPLLNRCTQSEQHRQITGAHEWLQRELNVRATLFAYPNGNHTPIAKAFLRELGYSVATLFDHRLNSSQQESLNVSRLRVGDGNSLQRFTAILAGSHPLLTELRSLPSRRGT